jgi:hypothetical protein
MIPGDIIDDGHPILPAPQPAVFCGCRFEGSDAEIHINCEHDTRPRPVLACPACGSLEVGASGLSADEIYKRDAGRGECSSCGLEFEVAR